MKKITLLLFTLLNASILFGQTQTYTNIRTVRVNNVDAIIENKQVIGYYVFYFKDKVNRKESAYELSLLDVNLNPTHTLEMVKPKNSYLLEASYNGTHFCFSFLNVKERSVEYQIVDKKAKIVGSYVKDELSNTEMQGYLQAVQSEEDTYAGGLVSVEGKGFVRYGFEKEKGVRYEIELIDNDAKKVWTANSGATTKKSFESATSFYADKNAIVSLISIREKAMSTDIDYYLLFTNPNDGKDLFRVSTEHEKGYLVAMGINHDANNTFTVYGEYYGKKGSKDRFDPENKIGFFMLNIDGSGKVIEEHFVDWKLDIAKLVPLNKKGRMEGNLSVFIHNLVKTADGKYFIIGEQFKKSASALGIANAALGGNNNVSTVRADLHDMIVFEFSSNFTPTKVYIIEKDMCKVLLPRGAGYLSMNMLGSYLKAIRAFDYSFTFLSDGSKTFNSSYVNYDKEKGEKNKYVIGNIVYNKQGELVTDQIPLTSRPTFFSVLPGKPGYILIFEYFKKKKELTVRLEKMDI